MASKKILVALLLAASSLSAAEPEPAALSGQAREILAVAHEKMAVCLRSQRPLAECRAELMRVHGSIAGQDGGPERKCCSMKKSEPEQAQDHKGH